MAFKYTGQFNGYVAKATGQIINYARDPKKYKFNKYTQLVKTDTELFRYYKIHPDDPVRFFNREGHIWQDGAMRPVQTGQRVRHDVVEKQTTRYDYDFQIGWRTLQNADYNVLLANTNSAENEAMIDWTHEVVTLIETASEWGSNTAQAIDLAGGAQWDAGTPEDPVIKKSLLEVAERITLLTNGMAADYENTDDVGLILVLAPESARRMAVVPEVHAIYKESLYADRLIERSSPNANAIWGLPERLYGFSVMVENAVRVSERPQADGSEAPTTGATPPRAFVKSPYSAVVLSRPGGLDGVMGAPSFSTIQRYYVESEMRLEIFEDKKNELTDGHVVRDGVTVMAAPAAGFLVQNILGVEA